MAARHFSDPGPISDLKDASETGSQHALHPIAPSPGPSVSGLRRSLRTFTLQRKNTTAAATPGSEPQNTWGQFGLQLLHSPPDPLIDFIFVHGLRGGSIKTWSKSRDLRLYWPQAWLPRDPDLQNARIHSFGYNSDWGDSKETSLDIHDFGRSLFGEISTSPELRKGRLTPILLIGHSMGGLVIKKAYLLARQDESAKSLADRLQCMFFLATPHRGSDASGLLNHFLKASAVLNPKMYITDLNRNSGTITSINEAFRFHADTLRIWSFYETMKTKKAGNSMMIVDRESAVIGTRNEHVHPLNADHLSVCKFESPSDPNYVLLRNSLAKAAEDILGEAFEEKIEESMQQLASLEAYLLIAHDPDDDLTVIESKKTPGSCRWINGLQSIQNWRDSNEPSMLVHWLSGQAGTGKSVLATHLIRDLQEVGADTCYYFFREGSKAQQTVSSFLRSLAYQMAVRHPSVRAALHNLREAGVVFDRDDELVIWRKVFIQCILPVDIKMTQFWIVDGLDECLDIAKLFPLLTRFEANFPLRLHFSSRRLPELEKLMSRLEDCLLRHHIEVRDTVPDIELFIQTHSQELPVEDRNRPELVKKLVMKSCGTFLWVELACEELGQVFSEDEIDEVLEHVPAGMAPLYNRILDSMAKHAQRRGLIRAVLEWTVCGTRSMTGLELQAALTLDLNSRVQDVPRIVEQLCGQLLRVDSHGVVQMIHATARDFLLDPGCESLFAIDKVAVNQRLAAVCLRYLTDNEMRPPRHPALVSQPIQRSVFASYASTSWSDHLAASSSTSDDIFNLVNQFFRTHVLAWAEFTLSHKKSLYYLTRAAKNLRKYLGRRAKHASPLGEPYNYLHRWETDLLRVSLKFGSNLLKDPAAIHFIVPQLCPKNSAIHQKFAQASSGPQVKGLADDDWDDCVCYIDYRNSAALCLASCEERFAIGMKSGAVKVYHQATCQIFTTFDHGEPVNVLRFDASSDHLASSGYRHVKLWAMNGSALWSVSTQSPFTSMAFVQGDQVLLAVDKSSKVVHLNAEDGSSIQAGPAPANDQPGPSRRRAPQIISSADICPEGKLVALAYRGKPAQIWSTEQNVMIRECHMARDKRGSRTMAISQVLFNPNPAIELLAVAYQDLELAIFDRWSVEGNEIKSLPGDAMMLAATADGRTLGTGDATGTIKLWDFETLTLLYCIKSNEYEVKALAFSGNGFQLFDIRDTKTKVWEPSALVRKTISEESSVSESVTAQAPVIGRQRDNVSITHLLAPDNAGCVLVGRDDGSVLACDWETGGTMSTLYTHQTREFVTNITWNGHLIASTDTAGRLEVHALDGSSPSGLSATRMAYTRSLNGPTSSLAMHPKKPLLLIAPANMAHLVNLVDETECPVAHPDANVDDYKAWTWLPSETSLLLGARQECVDVFSFEQGTISSMPLTWKLEIDGVAPPSSIEDVRCSGNGQYVAVILASDGSTPKDPKLLIYTTPMELINRSSNPGGKIKTSAALTLPGGKLKSFYGFHGDRIVFLGHDLWLWSIDLARAKAGATLESITERHFFIPREFIGGNNGVDGTVTAAGTIIFPKEGELAVVSSALQWPFTGPSYAAKGSPRRRGFGQTIGGN